MGFVRSSDKLGSFWPSTEQPGAELLKLTFEDGGVLFLGAEGSSELFYRVHPDFVPTQLKAVIEKYRFDPRDEASVATALVGFEVQIGIGNKKGGAEGHCLTASRLASIEICEYRDGYRGKLKLANNRLDYD